MFFPPLSLVLSSLPVPQTQPALLEACVREELNLTAPRAMVVLDPIRVTLKNYPVDKVR